MLAKNRCIKFVIICIYAIGISLFVHNTVMAEENTEAVKKASSTVVTIRTEKTINNQRQLHSIGSGVIYDGSNGFIVTNSHVLTDSDKINVIADGKVFPAVVFGKDEFMDVAVLKINPDVVLPQATLSLRLPKKDDRVFAVGATNGKSNTVSYGKVTSNDLKEFVHNSISYLAVPTDVPVAPGNSGGGLFDEKGNLVAITSAKQNLQSGTDVCCAIPIAHIKDVIPFLEHGKHYLPTVNIDTYDSGNGKVVVSRVSGNDNYYYYVTAVQAAIKPGDQIVAYGAEHRPLFSSLYFQYYIKCSAFSPKIIFFIQRNNEEYRYCIENQEYRYLEGLQLDWLERVNIAFN